MEAEGRIKNEEGERRDLPKKIQGKANEFTICSFELTLGCAAIGKLSLCNLLP